MITLADNSIILAISFIIGLCFGSFVTCASYRLPRDISLSRGRSFCPSCDTKLGMLDLIPLFSWLLSRGRCRHCQQKIGIRYPLTELILGVLFCLITLHFGLTPLTVTYWMFVTALLTMIIADFETKLIPDEIHYFLIPLGCLHLYLVNISLTDVLTCTSLALFTGLMLHYGYYWLRGKHGLGFGDVKFLAVAGFWIGDAINFVPFLCFSGIFGILTALLWKCISDDPRFPFGPALALSLALIVLIPKSSLLFWLGLTQLLGLY